MSAPKHTPGPWIVEQQRHEGFALISAEEWDGLARVVVRMHEEVAECEDGLANATLIAAAPVLADALKDLLVWSARAGAPWSPDPDEEAEQQRERANVRVRAEDALRAAGRLL